MLVFDIQMVLVDEKMIKNIASIVLSLNHTIYLAKTPEEKSQFLNIPCHLAKKHRVYVHVLFFAPSENFSDTVV